MIRHIFTLIWNERKANGWLLFEYALVFCILWFCCDYLYYMSARYLEPKGFNIEHTYQVHLKKQDPEYITISDSNRMNYNEVVRTALDRIQKHPAVECAAISCSSSPYGFSYSGRQYFINDDSTGASSKGGVVTADFFNVFRINVHKGSLEGWDEMTNTKSIFISPDHNGNFGETAVEDVHKLRVRTGEHTTEAFLVAGIVNPVKNADDDRYVSMVYSPFTKTTQTPMWSVEVSLRVRPDQDHDFVETFTKQMQDQLNIDVYYLEKVMPYQEARAQRMKEVNNQIAGVSTIAGFLIFNIFLGIIGTFWFRVQSRRSEIGLRMALGASKKRVKRLLIGETLLLLFVASIVGTIISLNLGKTDLLTGLGVPSIDREQNAVAGGQDLINYLLTFLFLAVISVLAVWFPTRQAAHTQPAEVLHEE